MQCRAVQCGAPHVMRVVNVECAHTCLRLSFFTRTVLIADATTDVRGVI
jgi:hypothetical protein